MKNTIKEIDFAVPSGKVASCSGQESECTHIECTLMYNLGGVNWATGRQEARGYYLIATPVRIKDYGDGLISKAFAAFSGGKMMLLECRRQSKGKEAEAVALFDSNATAFCKRLFPNAVIDYGEGLAA